MSSVDVVVPCYNYARYLNKCVESIINQHDLDVRVLIIDDASTDETPETGRALAELDPRVYYRRHDENKGHIATYNEGLLGWASAEYSLLLSADDALAPGALRRAVQLMNRHSDLGMTYGMALIITDDTGPMLPAETASDQYQIVSGSRFLQFCCANCYNPVPTPTAVVRTELQHSLGGYRSDFPHTGDVEMWMRFATRGMVGVLRAVQGYYRWHGQNMGLQYYNQVVGDRREFVQTCEYVLTPLITQFTESGLWLKKMNQKMEEQAFRMATRAFDIGESEECKAWLEFAKEMSPGHHLSPKWWRLRVKRFLGPALWQSVQPALHRLRGTPEKFPGLKETLFQPSQGQKIGWWPETP